VAAGLQALLVDPLPTEIAALLATRAEQLHARHAEEISTAKEAMTALLRQHADLLKPDAYNDLIVAYRNGSPVRIRDIGQAIEAPENDLSAMTLFQEVRPAAEGLARLASKVAFPRGAHPRAHVAAVKLRLADFGFAVAMNRVVPVGIGALSSSSGNFIRDGLLCWALC
jgi:hypothetical protein